MKIKSKKKIFVKSLIERKKIFVEELIEYLMGNNLLYKLMNDISFSDKFYSHKRIIGEKTKMIFSPIATIPPVSVRVNVYSLDMYIDRKIRIANYTLIEEEAYKQCYSNIFEEDADYFLRKRISGKLGKSHDREFNRIESLKEFKELLLDSERFIIAICIIYVNDEFISKGIREGIFSEEMYKIELSRFNLKNENKNNNNNDDVNSKIKKIKNKIRELSDLLDNIEKIIQDNEINTDENQKTKKM